MSHIDDADQAGRDAYYPAVAVAADLEDLGNLTAWVDVEDHLEEWVEEADPTPDQYWPEFLAALRVLAATGD
jgi:hypothetical protein